MLKIIRSKKVLYISKYIVELNHKKYSFMVSNRRRGLDEYSIFQEIKLNEQTRTSIRKVNKMCIVSLKISTMPW